MSNINQIITKVSNDTPLIELWSTNDTSSISIGYNSTNSLFSISSGDSLNLITINDSTSTFHNVLNLNTNSILNIAAPVDDNDLVTKLYTDNNTPSIPTAGAGLTLDNNYLNVDPIQTQITEVGNLNVGSIGIDFGDILYTNDITVDGISTFGGFGCDKLILTYTSLNSFESVISEIIQITEFELDGVNKNLNNPTSQGAIMFIFAGSGLSSTNVFIGGIGESGATFNAIGQGITLMSVFISGTIQWVIIGNNGTTIF